MIPDKRERHKVLHKLNDIIVIVLFAKVANADDWQTDDVAWLPQKSKWAGLKTIGMTKNTIYKDGVTTEEIRYFIIREDANQTLEKRAAYNLNIINKIALSVLKITDLGMKPMSLKKKRYSISLDPLRFLKLVLSA